jgi:hypothetical protein
MLNNSNDYSKNGLPELPRNPSCDLQHIDFDDFFNKSPKIMEHQVNQYTVDQRYEIGAVYMLIQKLTNEGCQVSSKLDKPPFDTHQSKKDLAKHLTQVNIQMTENFRTEVKKSKEAQVDGFLLVSHPTRKSIELEMSPAVIVFLMPCAICI